MTSIYEMADMLTDQVRRMTNKEFKVLQQALRLTYDPDTILVDQDSREIVGPATGTFWDWMHVLMSSGVANIEVYQLLSMIRYEGVTLESIDQFMSGFTLSGGALSTDSYLSSTTLS